MRLIKNYLGGELAPSIDGKAIAVTNPATGETVASCPRSNIDDVNQAVYVAKTALPAWRALDIQERAEYLFALANAIADNATQFAEAECNDTGKPLWLAKAMDIPRAIENCRFYARVAPEMLSNAHLSRQKGWNVTRYQPLGLVACITPWNLPLYLLTWKIVPALLMGNVVLAKPSEQTPSTAYLLSELCQELNWPAGVLSVLHGYGHEVGSSLVQHPNIAGVSFTGGTKTGRQIAQAASSNLKKVSLELGGKNAAIICADSQWRENIDTIVRACFSNQGQICLCTSRLLIESSIYEEFKSFFLTHCRMLQVDDPLTKACQQGAISSEAHFQKILAAIKHAVDEEGGNLLMGGHEVLLNGRCANGFFIEPTVLEGIKQSSAINQNEIFGPVVTLQPFDEDCEAIELTNATDYGLATCIWSQDLTRCQYFANHCDTGIVWVNCWMCRDLMTPFGGMKQSGVGREGGLDSLRFFSEEKTICFLGQ